MKLASLKTGGRDGTLVVVSRDLSRVTLATSVAPTYAMRLKTGRPPSPPCAPLQKRLEDGTVNSMPYDPAALASPLPRAFQWADGSAYLSHMRLVRKARGVDMPANSESDPLLYQGGGDRFLGPVDPIPCVDTEWGLDFEGEIAVVTDDVPMGCTAKQASIAYQTDHAVQRCKPTPCHAPRAGERIWLLPVETCKCLFARVRNPRRAGRGLDWGAH